VGRGKEGHNCLRELNGDKMEESLLKEGKGKRRRNGGKKVNSILLEKGGKRTSNRKTKVTKWGRNERRSAGPAQSKKEEKRSSKWGGRVERTGLPPPSFRLTKCAVFLKEREKSGKGNNSPLTEVKSRR